MVGRHLGGQSHEHGVREVGVGVRQGHVHAVSTSRRRAGEVGVGAVVGDGQGDDQVDRVVVTVDPHFVGVRAGGQSLKAFPGSDGCPLEDEGGQLGNVVQVELVEHGVQAAGARVVTARQRVQVADHLPGFAHVVAHDVQQVLVDHAPFSELHDGDEKPLFVNLGGVRSVTAAAHVDHVGCAGEEGDQVAVSEHRVDHGEVVQVAGALPRVVGDVRVALVDPVRADVFDEVDDRCGHGVDVAWGAGDRLGDHPALSVVDAGRQVAGFADTGAKRRAHQGQRLLLHDGNEPVPHHLVTKLAHGVASCRVTSRQPSACRTACWVLDSQVVV